MDQKNEKLHREFNDILTEFNKHNIKDNDVVYFTLQRLYKNLDDRVMAQKKGLDAKFFVGKKEGVSLAIYLFDKINER
jgi:hypothetical protein